MHAPTDIDVNAPSPTGGVDRESFIAGMRHNASGVVVVTTWVDDRPWGLTISSFISVSVDPPRVLVSLQSSTVTCRAVAEGGAFGVSVLASAHEDVGRLCSTPGAPKFIDEHAADTRTAGGPPRLEEFLVHMDCVVEQQVPVGDHTLLVARVTGLLRDTAAGDPLIYTGGAFHHLGPAVSQGKVCE